MTGQLNFNDGTVKQVQIRVAPTAAAEGRTIILSPTSQREFLFVHPTDLAKPKYYMRQQFFFKDESTTIERPDMTDKQVVINEPSELIFRMVPQFVDPFSLVKETLVDASYTHFDGQVERATLHLKADSPRSEFAVLLRPKDKPEWDAVPRFLMNQGDPVTGASKRFIMNEPFIGLTQAGLRVAIVELLEDPSVFTGGDLLAIKVVFGKDVANPALPTATIMLRGTRTGGAVVVPGVEAGAGVSAAVEMIRRGQAPERRPAALGPAETTLYVTL